MTKYEWEKELRSNIAKLPKNEVEKILDYYSELFDDKAERGMSEKEIIREFGNPFDVAYRIMREFDSTNEPENDIPTPNSNKKDNSVTYTSSYGNIPENIQEKNENDYTFTKTNDNKDKNDSAKSQPTDTKKADAPKRKNSDATLMRVLCFIPFVLAMIILWTIVGSLVVASVSVVIAGVTYMIYSFTYFGYSVAYVAATFGMGLAALGFGALFTVGTIKLFKATITLSKNFFGKTKDKADNLN